MSPAKRKHQVTVGPIAHDMMNRREFLASGLAGLLAAGLWPGRLGAQNPRAQFQFVVMNDTHFHDDRDFEYFEQVAKQIRSREAAADFILHAGDIADGALNSQLAPMKSFFDNLHKPYHVAPGNHDADRSDGSLRTYRSVFGNDSANTTFVHKGWQFVGLDSTEGTKYKNVQIQPANLAWLRETLAKLDRRKPLILFTHMPLGSGVPSQAANAEAVLSMLVEHNLKAIFNGHYHGYTVREYRGAEITTDRCLSRFRANHDGSLEKGYFRCSVAAGRISREFVSFNFKA